MRFDQASAAVAGDRAWFSRNPGVRIRFRVARPGEFTPLEAAGHVVPALVPSGVDPAAPLTWVAVIELSRCLGTEQPADGSSIRVRLRTVPIRSRSLQRRLASVYEHAVVQDFLLQAALGSLTAAA